ncbi:MAG: esterase [Bacteroidetes bacterium HGW-Bacteroidetes-5]|jgi:S-formylglutathione hydrolase FrmB|nr:MAG: esterase [Bacteroidetes bacterium HGW-Bacteroidetes-5]
MKTIIKKLLFLAVFAAVGTANAQEFIVFESKHLKCNDSVLVFTPANAVPGDVTPALFLLHGWSGNYKNWRDKTDIQAVSDKYGFIIITPDGFYNSWYVNNIDPNKMQWRKFFDSELYPAIMKKYRLDPNRSFISGLSMGGHGAINIFLDDTTRFRSAGSMSGVLNLHDTRLKEGQMTEMLGPYTKENTLFDQNSAIKRLESIKGIKRTMIISCGAQDGLAKSSREFSSKCDELGIPNILIMSPGVHNWPYWIFALDLHLFLFSKML